MRVNRTFSIPVELVHELRKKHNQSETVTRALRKYLEKQDEGYVPTILEASEEELLQELRLRFGSGDAKSELLITIRAMMK
jgi:hypothetical protein